MHSNPFLYLMNIPHNKVEGLSGKTVYIEIIFLYRSSRIIINLLVTTVTGAGNANVISTAARQNLPSSLNRMFRRNKKMIEMLSYFNVFDIDKLHSMSMRL